MIDCGFDESYKPNNPNVVVAAHFGTTQSMAKLHKRWKSALANARVPYFHAKDIGNGKSELFRHLEPKQRKDLLATLIRIVHTTAELGIFATINEDEYRDLTSERFRSQWGSAYTFAMQMVLGSLSVHLEVLRRSAETVNILLEPGHRNWKQAMGAVRGMAESKDSVVKIGSYEVGDKVHFPILQSADLLAFAANQEMQNGAHSSEMFRYLVTTKRTRYYRVDCNSEVIESQKRRVNAYFALRSIIAQHTSEQTVT